MIEITTKSSIRVNAFLIFFIGLLYLNVKYFLLFFKRNRLQASANKKQIN